MNVFPPIAANSPGEGHFSGPALPKSLVFSRLFATFLTFFYRTNYVAYWSLFRSWKPYPKGRCVAVPVRAGLPGTVELRALALHSGAPFSWFIVVVPPSFVMVCSPAQDVKQMFSLFPTSPVAFCLFPSVAFLLQRYACFVLLLGTASTCLPALAVSFSQFFFF